MNIFSGIFLWPDVLCGPASATWIQIPTGQPCVPLVQDGGLAHSRCSISLADYLLPNLILVIQSTIDLENIYWGACLPSTWPSKRGHLFIFFYFIFYFFFNLFFFICGGFCHTLKWNSQGFTCVPHPNPPSHLPFHPFPLGFPSAPGPSTCLMHPTWAGDLFHPR